MDDESLAPFAVWVMGMILPFLFPDMRDYRVRFKITDLQDIFTLYRHYTK